MNLKEQIDLSRLPKHVAIIMDGNGRWAKGKGKFRIFGHKNGVKAVRETAEAAAELGVAYLTLYAFSTENWNRPKDEVNALMELLISTIQNEIPTLQKNNIRLEAIGDLDSLPKSAQDKLTHAIEATKNNDRMAMILALSYSARWDLVQCVKQIVNHVTLGQLAASDISVDTISKHLSTSKYPEPELLIRTSGELRISNFLLWELAYSELYFTNVLWPDFRKDNLYDALIDFQNRERRFGKTSEQIENQ